jgi:hypothetical protein|tara:strand:- start:5577 stop:6080 length:504 start_codon:yes stop_codon:yes gene_type:complete
MAEEDTIFSSKMKYKGIFDFDDFYNFCYSWLTDEIGLIMTEKKYSEKLAGDSKNIEIKWEGFKNLTDYFRFKIKVEFDIRGLKKVEMNQGGAKVETNTGTIEMKVKGIISRDYDGKFEMTAFNKFLRSIYEKWVIPARIEEFMERIISDSDEFLSQAKAYLDLEGKR